MVRIGRLDFFDNLTSNRSLSELSQRVGYAKRLTYCLKSDRDKGKIAVKNFPQLITCLKMIFAQGERIPS